MPGKVSSFHYNESQTGPTGQTGQTEKQNPERMRKSLQAIGEKHGLTVITKKEADYNRKVLQSLQRAKALIDAFNSAFFGEAERSIEQVIMDMKEFTYRANGMRQSRISMLLEELKKRRESNVKDKAIHAVRCVLKRMHTDKRFAYIMHGTETYGAIIDAGAAAAGKEVPDLISLEPAKKIWDLLFGNNQTERKDHDETGTGRSETDEGNREDSTGTPGPGSAVQAETGAAAESAAGERVRTPDRVDPLNIR